MLGQLIECFDTCGSGAISLGLSEGINECCSSTEGSAFIDLKIANIVGCQSCIDIESEYFIVYYVMEMFANFFHFAATFFYLARYQDNTQSVHLQLQE